MGEVYGVSQCIVGRGDRRISGVITRSFMPSCAPWVGFLSRTDAVGIGGGVSVVIGVDHLGVNVGFIVVSGIIVRSFNSLRLAVLHYAPRVGVPFSIVVVLHVRHIGVRVFAFGVVVGDGEVVLAGVVKIHICINIKRNWIVFGAVGS